MKKYFIFIFLFSNLVLSQVPPYQFYCDIKDTKVEAQVEYDSSRNVYKYIYTVYSGNKNNNPIDNLRINISTKVSYEPIDPDLYDNCSGFNNELVGNEIKEARQKYSRNAIPVGLSNPWNYEGCGTMGHMRDSKGNDLGIIAGLGFPEIQPGESASGMKIEAKFPPGIRDFEIIPDFSVCYDHIPQDEEHWDVFPEGATDYEGFTRPKGFGKDEDWYFRGKTIGPIDPVDYQFYNGGGQKPDDVNLFLKYANPQGRETKLKNGESFDLIIYYGDTTIPSTFKAELNGQDITSKFHPVKGVAEVVKFTFPLGRNTLVLSIDGKNQKGNTATDTDRLVFVVE